MEGLPTITIMGYQALLFCADEKAIRVVSQVLADLDFHVELSAEPFSSVKRLTTEHFDALVVDCDDEQNAALLFKTARNSEHNNASLAVALVQGQGGIAKAFKIGANLILTKPVNAEQSKGTLRVARGMLRKAEAGKAAAAAAGAHSTGQTKSSPVIENVSATTAASSEAAATPAASAQLIEASTTEISAVVETKLETKKEPLGLLTSGETDLSGTAQAEPVKAEATAKADSSDSGKYSWQSKGKKSADTGATPAAETAPKAEGTSSPPTTSSKTATVDAKGSIADTKSSDSGARTGAAAARAKEAPAPETKSGSKAAAASTTPAAKKAEPSPAAPSAKKDTGKIDPSKLTAPSFSWSEAARDHEASGGSDSKRNFFIAAALVLALAGGGYYAWPQLEPVLMNIPVVQKYLGTESRPAPAPAPAPARQIPPPPAPAATSTNQPSATAPGTTPGATTAPAESASTATTAAATPAPASAPLTLTQTVSEQLLSSKPQPIYPAAARAKKLGGDVQLQATVGKDGAVTQVKVLNGDEILAHAATEAVRQWKYKPYVLNGQPAEFETPVTVHFKFPN